MMRATFLLVLSLLLSGCAVGYQARGTLSDVPGEMRGKGYPDNTRGGGRFVLADPAGRLTCDGRADSPRSGGSPESCAGDRGEGIARCNDGREIPFRWEAITCRSWLGEGIDALGNRLQFRVERTSR